MSCKISETLMSDEKITILKENGKKRIKNLVGLIVHLKLLNFIKLYFNYLNEF